MFSKLVEIRVRRNASSPLLISRRKFSKHALPHSLRFPWEENHPVGETALGLCFSGGTDLSKITGAEVSLFLLPFLLRLVRVYNLEKRCSYENPNFPLGGLSQGLD